MRVTVKNWDNYLRRKARVKLKLASYSVFISHFLIIVCLCICGIYSRPAKLILYRDDNSQIKYEINAQECRAGVFLMEPTQFSCACITGVWAFYTKFCEKPYMIMGGDGYCFQMSSEVKISQVILIGNPKYPFEPSISHFRENYIILTKSYTTDDDTLDIDAVSTFVSITGTSWTIKGDAGETLCLNPTEDRPLIFCLYDLTRGVINNWQEIVEVRRGCHTSNILEPQVCEEILGPNGTCSGSIETTTSSWKSTSSTPHTKIPSTTNPELSTVSNTGSTDMWSSSSSMTTTEVTTSKPRNKTCIEGITHENVKEFWKSPYATMCPRSVTELIFTDQLKRFAVLQMNRQIETRQKSLEQTEELLGLQADLIKITCPPDAVSPAFIEVVTEAFAMFIRDDIFYGVDETEMSLYERIIYDLKTCLSKPEPFNFTYDYSECNRTKILDQVIVEGIPSKIIIGEENSWKNYEPLIEAVWKMFLNSHSYCFRYFLRQNDHHMYAVRMLELFSNSIYEKWIQPLPTRVLYNYIVPNPKELELTMDNLDHCVGALNYNQECKVWVTRVSTKDSSQNGLISEGRISRKKRSIWIDHLQNNRENTEIWNGVGYCLQTAEDPSFHLGFGRCAHP